MARVVRVVGTEHPEREAEEARRRLEGRISNYVRVLVVFAGRLGVSQETQEKAKVEAKDGAKEEAKDEAKEAKVTVTQVATEVEKMKKNI